MNYTIDFTQANQILGGTTRLTLLDNGHYALVAGDIIITVSDFNQLVTDL